MSACGHLAFDDLPSTDDSLTSEAGSPGNDGSNNTQSDGSVDVDARTPRDGGGRVDGGGVVDANPGTDAGCPTCIVFVSQATGDDGNPGTIKAPVKTIAHGIEVAVSRPATEVHVATGHYKESITLHEGVTLRGGYACTADTCDWTKRDFVGSETQIIDQDFAGVLAPDTVTRATTMEGFTVVGRTGAILNAIPFGGAAMTLLRGTPTLSFLKITGGDTTATSAGGSVPKRSIGLVVAGPSNKNQGAAIDHCTITAGPAVDGSVGVLFDNRTADGAGPANATIAESTIKSGPAIVSVGVVGTTSGAATTLDHNMIDSAPSTANGSVVGGSWGISVSAGMTVKRNKINQGALLSGNGYCGSAANQGFCGGIQSNGSSANVFSNFIGAVPAGKSAGVLIAAGADAAVTPFTLNANTIGGGGGGSGTDGISASVVVRSADTAIGGPPGSAGIVRNNIFVAGSNKARYGVYEEAPAGKTVHLAELSNNDFFIEVNSTKDFAYRVWTGSTETLLPFEKLDTLLPAPTPNNNVNVDPMLNASLHLTASSLGVIDQGTSKDLAPTFDIDGDDRPQGGGIDIGADEFTK